MSLHSKAEKEKTEKSKKEHSVLSISDICRMLSITEATARNWVRLGKLVPIDPSEEGGLVFEYDYIMSLISNIKDDKSNLLKRRRNKKQISGNIPYDKYVKNRENVAIVQDIVSEIDSPSEKDIVLVLANYAIQLILQKNSSSKEKPSLEKNNFLVDYFSGKVDLGLYQRLVDDLFSGFLYKKNEIAKIDECLNYCLTYYSNEDILGLLYLSLRNMAERKTSGAYYTPFETVHSLISSLSDQTSLEKKSILDPCCGTGNFLIYLSKIISNPKLIFATEMDDLSVKLCRLNVALAFDIEEIDFLYENITCSDTLKKTDSKKYDVIIGNPPWGYDFSGYDINFLKMNYKTAKQKGTESYDLFIEKSISLLSKNGYLSFVLPEAVLNVSTHRIIRKEILNTCSVKFVSYIGNAFGGVQCPSIIIGLKLGNPGQIKGCEVSMQKTLNNKSQFTIDQNRELTEDAFPFNISNEHQRIIDKIEAIPEKEFLKDNAQFALGIVTGDNKNAIINSPQEGYEVILKGSNINKYRIIIEENYIKYEPEKFQQVAKEEIYRAPVKLVYRFICKIPVFAFDDSQLLTLNSCNILIPNIPDLDIKYVMAVLNSRVAAYYMQMKFNSVKILKSHLEQIPIPKIDKEQQEKIIFLLDKLNNCNARKNCNKDSCTKKNSLYNEIDEMIMDLYKLSKSSREVIKNSIDVEAFI